MTEQLSLASAGTKKALIDQFIETYRGECTIRDYRAFIAEDETYLGNPKGFEFYEAANRWRAERGLCRMADIDTGKGHRKAIQVCHGLEDVDYGISAVLSERRRTRKEEEEEDVKEPEEEETSKWDLIKNIFETAEEVILEKKDGKLHLSLSFGTD